MHQGVIFDIKEFSVHDGPGVRQTVFLKGCPLRCNWCHNPEGWLMQPQLLVRRKECIHCGACLTQCRHDSCRVCGSCVSVCPVRARWICGEVLTSRQLAQRIHANAPEYAGMNGGVTFSGGEPLLQADFLFETLCFLPDMHKVLETCGYAEETVFRRAMEAFSLIYMDLKIADSAMHQRYTGQDNARILRNLELLCAGSVPFVIRVPLIPGITDTEKNIKEIAMHLRRAQALQYVELLPYNQMAGAKYEWLGARYMPLFEETQKVIFRHDIFSQFGIESRGR